MSFRKIQFFVPGVPATAGSKKAFLNRNTGKIAVVDDCKRGASWRDTVGTYAMTALNGAQSLTGLLDEPLELNVIFYVVRPRGHYKSSVKHPGLKDNAPRWPVSKPDTTKLLRAVEDALKGIVWRDDSLVVVQTAMKVFADKPGAFVTISPVMYPSDYIAQKLLPTNL